MNTTAENTVNSEKNLKKVIKKINSYMTFPPNKKNQEPENPKKINEVKEAWEDEQAIADFKW